MIAEQLRALVAKHYSANQEPLLLSDLGKELRLANLWPVEGESRTLTNVIRAIAPELPIMADPEAKAFVVITPAGRGDIAEAAFARRHKLLLLKRLPRSILLAFCANTEQQVWVRTIPPFRYITDQPTLNDGYVLVDAKFRVPGLFIDAARNLAEEDALRLVKGLTDWAQEHNIDFKSLISSPLQAPSPSAAPTESSAHALERLYHAQSPEWRERLVVPVDIALALSRMP